MKGQGLSITTIVVAAIALLILVVLVAVFTGQFGKFSTGVNSCESRGGIEVKVSEVKVCGTDGKTECGSSDSVSKICKGKDANYAGLFRVSDAVVCCISQ